MTKQGRVFVICGAAGSGKTTVARYLRTEFQLHRVITHTTRLPRPGERDGVDYHFETAQSMAKLHLLEAVTYDQARYGSSLEGLAEGWQQGQDDVIVLDTKGAVTYYQQLGARVTIIFLTVSKLAALAHRMAERGDARPAIESGSIVWNTSGTCICQRNSGESLRWSRMMIGQRQRNACARLWARQ